MDHGSNPSCHRQVAERIGKGQYVRYPCIEVGMVLLVQDALDQGNAIQRHSKFYWVHIVLYMNFTE